MNHLRFCDVLLRMLLAMLFGGVIGMERERKRRPAGFRTYMLVCLGAALTMLLGQYAYEMLCTHWAGADLAAHIDVARIGAQVVGGIGFLGAGTILVTAHQEVTGLTTAAGLWTSACMGLAIGSGFYLCVPLALLLIFLAIRFLPLAENYIMENSRDLDLYVEFRSLDNIGAIIQRIKEQGARVYDVDLDRGQPGRHPSAVFTLRLERRQSHAHLLAAVSDLEGVCVIDQI